MKTQLDDDFDDDFEGLKIFKKNKVVTQVVQQRTHFYSLDYEITSFEQSDDLIRVLLSATSEDVIRIYISSNGGRVDVAELIVARIEEARSRGAIVIAELGFNVFSAATMIALACSDIFPSPHTQWMIHNWSCWGGYGHTEHLSKDIEFQNKQSLRFMEGVYEGFLSREELDELIKHPRDLYFNADEVQERWENKLAFEEDEEPVKSIELKDVIRGVLAELEAEKLQSVPKPKAKLKAPVKNVKE